MVVNMKAKKPRSGKAGYHHGDLRRALLVAAAASVEAGDASRLTLKAAADAAGVSVAAPYRHFADREALLAAVQTEGFVDLARRTDEARRAAPDPMSSLERTGLAYVRFAIDRPRLYRLMFGPESDKASHPALLEAGRAALEVLKHAVRDCRDAGLVGDADVDQVALAGWSICHGLASLHADGLLAGSRAAKNVDATARALVTLLIEGVRPRDDARRVGERRRTSR